MPQLDFVTYFGQIFWFLFFFSFLYSCTFSFVLPSFALVLKIRKKRLNNISNFSSFFNDENTSIFSIYNSLVLKSAFTSCSLILENKITANSWSNSQVISLTKNLLSFQYLNGVKILLSKKAAISSFIQ